MSTTHNIRPIKMSGVKHTRRSSGQSWHLPNYITTVKSLRRWRITIPWNLLIWWHQMQLIISTSLTVSTACTCLLLTEINKIEIWIISLRSRNQIWWYLVSAHLHIGISFFPAFLMLAICIISKLRKAWLYGNCRSSWTGWKFRYFLV